MGWGGGSDFFCFFHQKSHNLGMEPKNRQNRSINEDRDPPPLIKCDISSVPFATKTNFLDEPLVRDC